MILSIPTTACDTYIKQCHRVLEAKTEKEFNEASIAAQAYSGAIKDICGLAVWGEIVCQADLSFPDTVAVCAGVPMFFKGITPELPY